jgi:photosystem II stability/assembly factor-like uncharacterized protein
VILLSSCAGLPLEASMTSFPLQLDYGNVREDLGLVLTATINTAEAAAGDNIACRVRLRNIGPAVARLSCQHSFLFVLSLVDEGGNTVWCSMPDFVIGGPQDITLEVGKESAANFEVPLNQKGEYRLVAETTAKAPYPPDSSNHYGLKDLSLNLKIRVTPTLTPTPTSGVTVGAWEQLPSFGGEVFWCLAIDPGNPQTLYAGIAGDGICKSTNGGASWAASSSGLPSRDVMSLPLRDVMSLALDPGNPQTLYVGVRSGGVYKSSDGGANWADFSTGLPISPYSDVVSLAIDPGNPQTLYAGTAGGGVWKSSDGGANWAASSSGLPSPGVWVWCLAIDPSNPQTLYAAANSGVCKSTNSGASWAASSSGLPNSEVASLALDPGNPQTLYAGTAGGGVWKSSDGGASWGVSSNGLPSPFGYSLAIDPSNPQTLYAGTNGGEVFKSADGGASWTASSTGLPNSLHSYVGSLAIDPSGILYAVTGTGIFRMAPEQ